MKKALHRVLGVNGSEGRCSGSQWSGGVSMCVFCVYDQARRIIGDFGIPISILVFVLVDYSIPDTYTQVGLRTS